MKEKEKGVEKKENQTISVNIPATLIVRIYYTFRWMNDNKCYSNEKNIHSSRNKSNHGIVALSAQKSRNIDRSTVIISKTQLILILFTSFPR